MSKLPADAFTYYCALGDARSHQAVADHFGTTKRAVTKRAVREDWATRLEKIEAEARRTVDAKIAGDLVEMHLRHRKMLTAMAARAATALRDYPLSSGMDGIKAAGLVIKLERLLAGEPTDRSTVDIEAITKREIRELLILPTRGAGSLEDDEEEPEEDDEG